MSGKRPTISIARFSHTRRQLDQRHRRRHEAPPRPSSCATPSPRTALQTNGAKDSSIRPLPTRSPPHRSFNRFTCFAWNTNTVLAKGALRIAFLTGAASPPWLLRTLKAWSPPRSAHGLLGNACICLPGNKRYDNADRPHSAIRSNVAIAMQHRDCPSARHRKTVRKVQHSAVQKWRPRKP